MLAKLIGKPSLGRAHGILQLAEPKQQLIDMPDGIVILSTSQTQRPETKNPHKAG